jgi:hypothetical protein
MLPIPIPQTNPTDAWAGTTGVKCPCGGDIEWAEAAYSPGARACRSCLSLYYVRGRGESRRLQPQTLNDDHVIADASPDDEVYQVPEDLYPGWHV